MFRLLALVAAGAMLAGAAPSITRFSPDHALSGGAGFTLTVTGTGFASGALVRWGGVALATTFVNETTLTAAVGAERIASAGNVTVTVESGGNVSAGLAFPVSPGWKITGATVREVDAGSGDLTITYQGQGFPADAYFTFESQTVTRLEVASLTATAVSVRVPAAMLESPRFYRVFLRSAACACGVEDSLMARIRLDAIVPDTVAQTTENVEIRVRGSLLSGQRLNVCVDPAMPARQPCTSGIYAEARDMGISEVRLLVYGPGLNTTGQFAVVLRGTDSGSRMVHSTPKILTVTGGPSFTSVTPSILSEGQEGVTLTVKGSAFTASSEVVVVETMYEPQQVTRLATTRVSETELRAVLPAGQITKGHEMLVTVWDGAMRASGFQRLEVYGRPVITKLEPAKVRAGSGGLTLTVRGDSFSADAKLWVDRQAIAARRNDPTWLEAGLGAQWTATAGTHQVEVETFVGRSAAAVFTVEAVSTAPVLSSLSPSWVAAGAGRITMVASGSGFTSSSKLMIAGQPMAVTSVTAERINLETERIVGSLPVGRHAAYVEEGGQRSNELEFLVTPSPGGVPEVTELQPAHVPGQNGPVQVTVKGRNFVPGDWIEGRGVSATTYENAETLTAWVTVTTSPEQIGLVVRRGGESKGRFYLTVEASASTAPRISGLTPEGITAGAAGVWLRVAGQNLRGDLQGGVVRFRGTALSTNFLNGELSAQVPQELIREAGPAEVVVTVAGTASVPANLTVYPAPQLSAVAPARMGLRSGTALVTLQGANLRSGAAAAGPGVEWSQVDSAARMSVRVRLDEGNLAEGLPLRVVQDGVASNLVTLGLDFEAKLTALQPASARVGTEVLPVIASGTGLVYWYRLCWNGTPLDTTFTVDGAGLSGMVPGELRKRPGTAEVTACAGPYRSNALTFTVTAGPEITSVWPAGVMAGRGDFALTLEGRGFVADTVVTWNDRALPTEVVSETTLTARVPAELVAEPGTARVVVLTPTLEVAGPLIYVIQPKLGMGVILENGRVRLTLDAGAPRELRGEFELSGTDEAALQFWSGGRRAAVTVPEGQTEAVVAGAGRLQEGTSPGERTARLTRLEGGGVSYLPAEAAVRWTVGVEPPRIEALRWRGEWLEVDVVAPGRDLTEARITFIKVGATDEVRTFALDLQDWYQSDEGRAAGGAVRLRFPSVPGAAAQVIVSGASGRAEAALLR